VKKTIFVDANIVIRFFLKDHPTLYPQAYSIFSKAESGLIDVYLDEVVAAEIVWSLTSFYKKRKEEVVDKLEKLLSQEWVINPRKKLLLKTLSIYKEKSLDYIDCWIFVINNYLETELETFDHRLKKLI